MSFEEDQNKLFEFTSLKKKAILEKLINSYDIPKSIDVAKDVYNDTCIEKWCENLPVLSGSKLLIKKIVQNPVNNVNLLLSRQSSLQRFDIDLSYLDEIEDDILWIFKLDDELKDNNLVDILYPSTFLISYINNFDFLLESYHTYKIYYIPITAFIYPILSIFAPLYYLNNQLKFNVSIKSYMNMILKFLKMVFTFNNSSLKTNLIKFVTISLYIFLFVYNFYQTVEYSRMLYVVKNSINKKISNMNIFLKQATNIIESVPDGIVENFVLVKKNNFKNIKFTNLFKLWKDTNIRKEISDILIKLYTIDVIQSMGNILNTNNWCKVDYGDKTIMWNAKNPILGTEQKANPVNLSKNLIITGPNAAGKTTYIKTILSNVILSQTFGISNSLKSTILIYDTIASLMRISDVLGSRSYFETEAEYCKNMISKALDLYKNGRNGLFLLDEPMHSTPPTEGVSTAFAVAEHIGNLANINVLLTTHFHKLTSLETQYPDTFINLSVKAIKTNDGFHFPYKINRGYSYQCIAIELLSTKDFPEEVIESAINMKNKICSEIIR